MQIIVADDDERVRSSLCRILAKVGYVAIGVANGREAFPLLPTADAVVTDIYMPDLDGVELLIRARELNPDLPVICISGGGFREAGKLLDDALALGAVAAFRKPVTPQALFQALNSALGGRQLT